MENHEIDILPNRLGVLVTPGMTLPNEMSILKKTTGSILTICQ